MKMRPGIIGLLFMLLFLHSVSFGQQVRKTISIPWQAVQTISGIDNAPLQVLKANGLTNNPGKGFTPEYFEKFTLPSQIDKCNILVTNTLWEPIPQNLVSKLTYPLQADQVLTPHVETGLERGITMAMLTLNPIVINPAGGLMRLKSFDIDIVYLPPSRNAFSLKSGVYASHSLLAKGDWFKLQLNKTGIYKVTYADMQAMGVNMAKVTPANIRLFGNGGGMLPESNSISRNDDLKENAIQVVTVNAASFSPGDYILFYGTAPDNIVFNKTTRRFHHYKNCYSDYTYYFLNFDSGAGLRISDIAQSTQTPNASSESFTDFAFYEKDSYNLIKSGKQWVGERMDAAAPTVTLPDFNFPNPKPSANAYINYRLVSRASAISKIAVKIDKQTIATPTFGEFSTYTYGTESIGGSSFVPSSAKVQVSLQYDGNDGGTGWLDWVELNVIRDLKFNGGQLAFADPATAWPSNITRFTLTGSTSDVNIWEVTNPVDVKKVMVDFSGTSSSFTLSTDSLRQFVAFDKTSFLSVTFTEKVPNQDLHGIAKADMLIVTHKDFLSQARQLADFHSKHDNWSVSVVTNEQVYNEFSSGAPDASAIRDFARMLYKRPAAGARLRYLLLYGDGSYDNKTRLTNNTNKVLTYQNNESLMVGTSYATDDFYGMLDDNEGNEAQGLIDIGIGRLPVNTVSEAQTALDKISSYASEEATFKGNWRNQISFIADDQDGNEHFRQVENFITPPIKQKMPQLNIQKIYLDAYKQVTSAGRQRYPDVNKAITETIAKGVLLLNYTGHGGELGLADESILSINEIDAWTNMNHLPVFITATCEFSRYDDPNFVSAGEHVFLNPLGGAIALFTTSRVAISEINKGLNLFFYDTLFAKYNGEFPRFGDVIAFAKNQIAGSAIDYIRNFVLLGDPALHLAIPKYDVKTTEINGHAISSQPDTIQAMSGMQIKGKIADASGEKLTWFNGVVDIQIFDKERTLYTLANDSNMPDGNNSYVAPFQVQDNVIYQGKATVTNGEFACNFIVPKDIDYKSGFGKISYYASSDTTDASGYYTNILIGGTGPAGSDNTGPTIKLTMNDDSFIDGGLTGDTPTLIAYLSDESGINTLNNGIGHDIAATLDANTATTISLNNYYTATTDNYKSGVVRFRFTSLDEGKHSLTLKAWDVFNNSSEATINFEVRKNLQISVNSILTYPNPFRDETHVMLEFNLYDTPIETTYEIYNINGSLVRSIGPQRILPSGNKFGPITWDGLDGAGNAVKPGIYLFGVRANYGSSSTMSAKQIIKLK